MTRKEMKGVYWVSIMVMVAWMVCGERIETKPIWIHELTSSSNESIYISTSFKGLYVTCTLSYDTKQKETEKKADVSYPKGSGDILEKIVGNTAKKCVSILPFQYHGIDMASDHGYEVCFKGGVSQWLSGRSAHAISIGKSPVVQQKGQEEVVLVKDGEQCGKSSKLRETTLHFICGTEEAKIIAVAEHTPCEYDIYLSTTAACKDGRYLQSLPKFISANLGNNPARLSTYLLQLHPHPLGGYECMFSLSHSVSPVQFTSVDLQMSVAYDREDKGGLSYDLHADECLFVDDEYQRKDCRPTHLTASGTSFTSISVLSNVQLVD